MLNNIYSKMTEELQLQYQVLSTGQNDLPSLGLSSPICKMGTIILSHLQSC